MDPSFDPQSGKNNLPPSSRGKGSSDGSNPEKIILPSDGLAHHGQSSFINIEDQRKNLRALAKNMDEVTESMSSEAKPVFTQQDLTLIKGSLNLGVEKLIALKDPSQLNDSINDYGDFLFRRLAAKPELEAPIEKYLLELYDKAASGQDTGSNKLRRRVLAQLIWAGMSFGSDSIYHLLEVPIKRGSNTEKLVQDAQENSLLSRDTLTRILDMHLDASDLDQDAETSNQVIKNLSRVFKLKSKADLINSVELSFQETLTQLVDLISEMGLKASYEKFDEDDDELAVIGEDRQEQNDENRTVAENVAACLDKLDVCLFFTNCIIEQQNQSKKDNVSPQEVRKLFKLWSFDKDLMEDITGRSSKDCDFTDYPNDDNFSNFIEMMVSAAEASEEVREVVIQELGNYIKDFSDYSYPKATHISTALDALAQLKPNKLREFCYEQFKKPNISQDFRASLILQLADRRSFYDEVAKEIKESEDGSENLEVLLSMARSTEKVEGSAAPDYLRKLLQTPNLSVEDLIDSHSRYVDEYHSSFEPVDILNLIAVEIPLDSQYLDSKLDVVVNKLLDFLNKHSNEFNLLSFQEGHACAKFMKFCHSLMTGEAE